MGLLNRRREMGGKKDFDGFLIKGKWTDDSTAADWWFKFNYYTQIDLTDFTNPDTKEFEYKTEVKPTTLRTLFYHNNAIERIDRLKGTENCTSLALGLYNNSLVHADLSEAIFNVPVDFSNLCWGGTSLTDLYFSDSPIILSAVNYILNGATKISTLKSNSFDTSGCTNFHCLLWHCEKLEELDMNLDFSKATDVGAMFDGCKKLTSMNGRVSNLSQSIRIEAPFDNASAMKFINALVDVGEERTITFSKTTFGSLTEEQIKKATDKGWNVLSI